MSVSVSISVSELASLVKYNLPHCLQSSVSGLPVWLSGAQ